MIAGVEARTRHGTDAREITPNGLATPGLVIDGTVESTRCSPQLAVSERTHS